MSITEKITGRAKQAFGGLTGDSKSRREGRHEEHGAAGKAGGNEGSDRAPEQGDGKPEGDTGSERET